jgi:hypothetical protein
MEPGGGVRLNMSTTVGAAEAALVDGNPHGSSGTLARVLRRAVPVLPRRVRPERRRHAPRASSAVD